jgi:methylglutaconyl-CoA hydratase
MEHVKLELGVVSRVVLNRPEVRNAMSDQTLRELTLAFHRIAQNEAVRVVVVTGEGQDFCAGADVKWMSRSGRLPAEEGKKDARLLAEMLQAVDGCPVPVIVGAHGHVFGGGLGLVAACDVPLLSDGVKMSFPECRLGIVPAVISNWVLPKIGAANARRYYLTGEVFGATKAVEMGLACEVVANGELSTRIDSLCCDILKNGPEAVRAAKTLISKMSGKTLKAGLELTVGTLVRLRSSPEGQEGLSAFLERRAPKWVAKP